MNRHETIPMMTIDDVAERLGFSARTIRRWIESGRIEAVRFGRRVRISSSEVARVEAAGITDEEQ